MNPTLLNGLIQADEQTTTVHVRNRQTQRYHSSHHQRQRGQLHGGRACLALSVAGHRAANSSVGRIGGQPMRTAFIETLLDLAEHDDSIWLLAGDLGYSVLEPFVKRFPNCFVNVGVAEQNLTGEAAGLALCGKTVFTYSIASFPSMHCLEQIRNDVCYHNLNLKIVAVGGGLVYGSQGYTHHTVEDLLS
jgi:deoxyxylulose-5-phosphate synthase